MKTGKRKKQELKEFVWAKSGGVCARCGRAVAPDKRTIDHFVPKYHGGTDDIDNLVPLCKACNKAKASRLMPVDECCPYMFEEYKELAAKYAGEQI